MSHLLTHAVIGCRCETVTTDVEAFRGQRVLVLGLGNAAMEVASHAMHKAAHVHVFGPQDARVSLAWATHYVGTLPCRGG